MPSVLENINNEDNLPVVNQLDHKYDETKLRSPSVRSVDQNSATVHVLSTINSSNNSNNSSFAFTNPMKTLTNDDLKKSHQQQLYQQHNSNQVPHQLNPQQQQHPVLISTSPPNLMNHLNPNLDNVRRVQNQYQLSNLQRISSPSNLIYNSQTQVGAPGNQPPNVNVGPPNPATANVNIYQQLIKHNTMMAQFHAQATQPTAHHFAAQHILQQQHQRTQLGQQNQPMFVPAQVAPQLTQQLGPPQTLMNPSNSGQPVNSPNDFRFNQQNIAAPHLINLNKQHYVQPQTMHGPPQLGPGLQAQLGPSPQAGVPQPQSVQTPTAFYQNQNLQNVSQNKAYGYPQTHQIPQQMAPPPNQPGHVLAAQPPNPQYNYITSQQFNMMNAQNQQQLANAQNYRNQKRFI